MNPLCEGWSGADTCVDGEVRLFKREGMPGLFRMCRGCYDVMIQWIEANPLLMGPGFRFPDWDTAEPFKP